jgi:hypothetical protein
VRNSSSSSRGQADAAAVTSAARDTKLTKLPWKSAGVSSWRKAASFSAVCSSVVSHTTIDPISKATATICPSSFAVVVVIVPSAQ